MKGVNGEQLLQSNHAELLDLKIFKVTRHHVQDKYDQSQLNMKQSSHSIEDIDKVYSINQIMEATDDFLSSRIFKIEYKQRDDLSVSKSDIGIEEKIKVHEQFHYVQLKVKVMDPDQKADDINQQQSLPGEIESHVSSLIQ